jgi:hypothetical protein
VPLIRLRNGNVDLTTLQVLYGAHEDFFGLSIQIDFKACLDQLMQLCSSNLATD